MVPVKRFAQLEKRYQEEHSQCLVLVLLLAVLQILFVATTSCLLLVHPVHVVVLVLVLAAMVVPSAQGHFVHDQSSLQQQALQVLEA